MGTVADMARCRLNAHSTSFFFLGNRIPVLCWQQHMETQVMAHATFLSGGT